MVPELLIGLEWLPSAQEVTPRAVAILAVGEPWVVYVGTSSRRTSTVHGEQGVFGTFGIHRAQWGASLGVFQEFSGEAFFTAGARISWNVFDLEPFYDGQFFHVGVARTFGEVRLSVARTGTGRFSATAMVPL